MEKKLSVIALSMAVLGVSAQEAGRFEKYDFDSFTLHVYYTNDALGDVSYIVEGRDSLVTMEQPLFKENVAEFDAWLCRLAKPVEQRIVDYHVGGTADNEVVMPEGMPDFIGGPVYSGMMRHFEQVFGEALTDMPTGAVSEVAFGATRIYGGIPFEFHHGASTDFPGASILIGGEVYYTHWAPAKAHVSHLQVSSPEAIDAEILEGEKALQSRASLFIGGHGGVATADAVRFRIDYLNVMKRLLAAHRTPDAFIEAMKTSYPGLPGEEGLGELAASLYK